jgi:hypothetical protein
MVNRTYADMARHYGTAIVPARPYKPEVFQRAGRMMTPSNVSPVVTKRQSAMSSLRANATIIVLRQPLDRKSPIQVRCEPFWGRSHRRGSAPGTPGPTSP